MHIRDLSSSTYNGHVNGEFIYRSVGWLGDRVQRTGASDPEIVRRLQELKAKNQLPDYWRGLHTCEVCVRECGASGVSTNRGGATDKGEFFIEQHNIRYVLPNMVLHYILQHGYRLPDVVEQAIRPSRPQSGIRVPTRWRTVFQLFCAKRLG